jgi:hypothetical protein
MWELLCQPLTIKPVRNKDVLWWGVLTTPNCLQTVVFGFPRVSADVGAAVEKRRRNSRNWLFGLLNPLTSLCSTLPARRNTSLVLRSPLPVLHWNTLRSGRAL